jgi:hypothetical protein
MKSKIPTTPKTPENPFSDAEIPDDDPRDGDFVMDIVDNEMNVRVNTMENFHGQTGEGFYGTKTGEGFKLGGKGEELDTSSVDEDGGGMKMENEKMPEVSVGAQEEDGGQTEGCITMENEDLLR